MFITIWLKAIKVYCISIWNFMRKRLTKQKELKKKFDNIQHEITVLEQKRDKLLDYNMGGYISDAEFFKQKQGFYTADSREKSESGTIEKHETSFKKQN